MITRISERMDKVKHKNGEDRQLFHHRLLLLNSSPISHYLTFILVI